MVGTIFTVTIVTLEVGLLARQAYKAGYFDKFIKPKGAKHFSQPTLKQIRG